MLPRTAARAGRHAARGVHTSGAAQAVYKDPNFPLTHDNRVHHLDVTNGEVANRILSVGDSGRARRIATFLDHPDDVLEVDAKRGFLTLTGTYNGVAVSIIGTGMGVPMMDFLVRETRAVVDGEMAIARLGSCGGMSEAAVPGSIVVATDGCCSVFRDPQGFLCPSPDTPCYRISDVVRGDSGLTQDLLTRLRGRVGDGGVVEGVNVTCDTFYSSQARIGEAFDDRNETLLDDILAKHPTATCMEMESFHLLDLAHHSKGSIRATAAAIVLANRKSAQVLDSEEFERLEREGGIAVLETLVAAELAS